MPADLTSRLSDFSSAVARLEDALAQPRTEWTRDAAIQRFEFTFELGWKSVAAAAQQQGLDVGSPLRAWQTAMQLGWIDDDRLWLDMVEDRNRASHSYREATAEKIRERLPVYALALRTVLQTLRQHAS